MIGVFGGTGFYRFLDDVEEVPVATPYGRPSAPLRVGRMEGADVAFMPRHGDEHTLPPHRINYRANVWAMREVGVTRILGPAACGSLKPELEPGHVRDLRPVRRPHPGAREHLLRRAADHPRVGGGPLLRRSQRGDRRERGGAGHPGWSEGGTVVVIQGPRFSTRAESRWFAASGFDVVNMTQYPECWLARELELCYTNIALVTDYDVGLEGMPQVEPVSADVALAGFRDNLERLRALLFHAIPRIGPQPQDACATALHNAIVR